MKLQSLYISPQEIESGAVVVSFGLMALLKRKYEKVAFFRPIVSQIPNNDIDLIVNNFKLQMDKKDCFGVDIQRAKELISANKTDKLYEILIEKYENLKANYDFVLIQGVSEDSLSMIADFDINLELAKNFDTNFVAVLNGKEKTYTQLLEDISMEEANIKHSGCVHFATFINRTNKEYISDIESSKKDYLLYCIEEVQELSALTIWDIQNRLNAQVVFEVPEYLHRTIDHIKVAAMSFDNYIKYIEPNDLIIVPADRSDIVVGSIAAVHSKTIPSISCILLTGDMKLKKPIKELLKGFNEHIPILKVQENTFEIAKKVSDIKAIIKADNKRKTSIIEGLFTTSVDIEAIEKHLLIESPHIVTPLMFEYSLLKRARENKQTIVLPEAKDERILKATQILLNSDVVDIVLLGNELDIKHRASLLGLNIDKAKIIDPTTSKQLPFLSEEFYNLRKDKGLTLEQATETLQTIPNYFATMMVQTGLAGGMVSGSISTTADTVRPALQIIKTKPGINIVSSVFFMCLDTKVLVYGDCAINLDPTAVELADIAKSSAQTAQAFGIEPKVAMLSYSTGQSGSGDDVEKVKEATKILQDEGKLLVEGPIQYDAAIEKSVAAQKLPNSLVAGDANVLIFPDLNTGNNTYKAVQRSSGAVAIGPVLQGLNKPINDLSRGCLVSDIVNTIAITAIQAQAIKAQTEGKK
jgi:phosphate acetyltransferase